MFLPADLVRNKYVKKNPEHSVCACVNYYF